MNPQSATASPSPMAHSLARALALRFLLPFAGLLTGALALAAIDPPAPCASGDAAAIAHCTSPASAQPEPGTAPESRRPQRPATLT